MVQECPSYEMHGTGRSSRAIFTFGSYVNLNRNAPSYAFMKTCLDMQAKYKVDCDIYYFLAKANDWYHSGVFGLGDDFEQSEAALRNLRGQYDKTVYVGNSMGGYAALAFGFLTDASRIVAFSPQTSLDRAFQTEIGETRWRDAISEVQAKYDGEAFAIDNLIRKRPGTQAQAQLFVGKECSQDVAYAKRLRFSPNVTVTEVPGEGHDLVHALRETGELVTIIHEAITD